MEDRRERTLTDKDIELIAKAMKKADHCFFDEETRSLLRMLTKIYSDGRNAAIKGLIAMALLGLLYFAAFGAGFVRNT